MGMNRRALAALALALALALLPSWVCGPHMSPCFKRTQHPLADRHQLAGRGGSVGLASQQPGLSTIRTLGLNFGRYIGGLNGWVMLTDWPLSSSFGDGAQT